jgi:hypothetical protein
LLQAQLLGVSVPTKSPNNIQSDRWLKLWRMRGFYFSARPTCLKSSLLKHGWTEKVNEVVFCQEFSLNVHNGETAAQESQGLLP